MILGNIITVPVDFDVCPGKRGQNTLNLFHTYAESFLIIFVSLWAKPICVNAHCQSNLNSCTANNVQTVNMFHQGQWFTSKVNDTERVLGIIIGREENERKPGWFLFPGFLHQSC